MLSLLMAIFGVAEMATDIGRMLLLFVEPVSIERAFEASKAEAELSSGMKFGKIAPKARKARAKRPLKRPRRFKATFWSWSLKLVLMWVFDFWWPFWRLKTKKAMVKEDKIRKIAPPRKKGVAVEEFEVKKPVSGTIFDDSVFFWSSLVSRVLGIVFGSAPSPVKVSCILVPGPDGDVAIFLPFCFYLLTCFLYFSILCDRIKGFLAFLSQSWVFLFDFDVVFAEEGF